MKTSVYLALATALTLAALTGCSKGPQFDDVSDTEAPMELKTEAEKSGYAVGIEQGENLKEQFKNLPVDLKALARGFSDELYKREKKLPLEEIRATITNMRKKVFDKADIEIDPKQGGYCIGLDHGSS